MPNICLPPKLVDAFKNALVSGKVNPEQLANMTSDARHALFKDIVGESNAKHVNGLFESKMLLKNQQAGYLAWAKKVAGVTPAVRQDMITKISKMDKFLNPADEKLFLKDLAATRLGVQVTAKEARQITKLSTEIQAAKDGPRTSLTDALKKGWSPSEHDLRYGRAQYDMHEYLNGIKHGSEKFQWSDLKGKTLLQTGAKSTKAVVDLTKSIGASLDNSFALRQGAKSFWTNNRIWQKEFKQSFVNIVKGAKDAQATEREFHATLMADPAYESAIKDGLALKSNEDAFPTSLPGKVPVIGRAFNASEIAYNAFAQNLRMAIYKKELAKGLDMGSDMPADYGKNMAKMVNSLTGRGDFGKVDNVAGALNVAFYSARFLKSNFDTLLLHPAGIGVGGIGSAAQKKAAGNLAKIVVGTAGIMATANALMPGSAETDPRSSNFGKIKVGDTTFDISGGMAPIVVLAARIATGESKSASTGIITKLNTGAVGAPTEKDVFLNFFEGKLSPVGGVVRDKLAGKTMDNQPVTVKTEASNLFQPLGIKNFNELRNDPHAANTLAAVIADGLGVSTNTKTASNKNANLANSAVDQAFKKAVGTDKFNKATADYNNKFNDWLNSHRQDLQKLPAADQQKIIAGAKNKIMKTEYKDNGFKPPKTPQSQGQKDARKSLLSSIK